MSKEPKRNVYVGHRYVPKIMGEWDKTISYEGLSIVTNEGTSYTSKKRVPVGIDILDNDYWVVTGNYDSQVENYRQEVRYMGEYVDDEVDKLNKYVDGEVSDLTEYVSDEVNSIKNDLQDIVVNVKNFGASIDLDDNSNPINNAIDFVELHGGGTVLIPEGTYKYSNDIHIKRGVELKGKKGTVLKCTVSLNASLIFYKESGISDLWFEFEEDFNGIGFDFVNEYMLPYDEGGVKPDTSNAQVNVNNIRVDKPFNYETINATTFRLLSTGRHGREIYSGFWGVNFYNVKVFGFNLVYLLKTENNGWVNGCKFDKIVADKIETFMRFDKSEDSLGIDFNTVSNSDLQTREMTKKLFDDPYNTTTIVENTSFWDVTHNPNSSVGDIENLKNPRDFQSLPVTRYSRNFSSGTYYLLGKFKRREKSSTDFVIISLKGTNNKNVEFLVRRDGKVEHRNIGQRTSLIENNVKFFMRDLDDGTKELYFYSEEHIPSTPIYFKSVNYFAISVRTTINENVINELYELDNINYYGGFRGILLGVNNGQVFNGDGTGERIVSWNGSNEYDYGESTLFKNDYKTIHFNDDVKRVKISFSLRFRSTEATNGRLRIRLLKNGSSDYYGSVTKYIKPNADGSSLVQVLLNTPVLRVYEDDEFEVEVTSNIGEVIELSSLRETWLSTEVISD